MLSDRADLLTFESPPLNYLMVLSSHTTSQDLTMNLAIPKLSAGSSNSSLVQAQFFNSSQDPLFMDFIKPLAMRVDLQRLGSWLLHIIRICCLIFVR